MNNSELWSAVVGPYTKPSTISQHDIPELVDQAIDQGLGFWYVVPKDRPNDYNASGDMRFEYEMDAMFAVKELKLCGPDFDIDWTTKFCPIDRQITINKLQAFWREHAIT